MEFSYFYNKIKTYDIIYFSHNISSMFFKCHDYAHST